MGNHDFQCEQNVQAGFALSEYTYALPQELIAQRPRKRREESRLLVVEAQKNSLQVTCFSDLKQYLPPHSLIIVNNSKVVPARLHGRKENLGKAEMVLLTPLRILEEKTTSVGLDHQVQAEVLLRPSKTLQPGARLEFPAGLQAHVKSKRTFGQCAVVLKWSGKSLLDILSRHGEVPLPPYIRRAPDREDALRYQTVYAKDTGRGSVAAPTAGLHFTEDLKAALIGAGHEWCELTLFVGYGTFSPIRCQDIREHVMHPEYCDISEQSAETIAKAIREKRPIIAVGTTSLRCVEGVLEKHGRMVPYRGTLETYIYPGFRFQAVQGLITNFHLPESSLFVLVCALAGRDRILAAYQRAVAEKMRFFSYGDAMFINNFHEADGHCP